MELKGQITELIYKNDSNSYTIAEFEKNMSEDHEKGIVLTISLETN